MGLEARVLRSPARVLRSPAVSPLSAGPHINPSLPHPCPNTHHPPHAHHLLLPSALDIPNSRPSHLCLIQVILKFSPSRTNVAEAWMVGLGEQPGSAGVRNWDKPVKLIVRMVRIRIWWE